MKNMNNILCKEIWLVEFNPQIGAEISKTRPAVVISSDIMFNLPLKFVVPITSWRDDFSRQSWKIKLKNYDKFGLDKLSAIDCFQIKSFSVERFVRKIGEIDDKTLFEIHQIVANILDPSYDLIK